jgi:cyanophycinase
LVPDLISRVGSEATPILWSLYDSRYDAINTALLIAMREPAMPLRSQLLSALIVCGFAPTVASTADPVVGPPQGSLVIVGGGRLPKPIVDEFVRLAGGVDQPVVIIPTAAEGEEWGDEYRDKSFLKRAGFESITVLHTRDPKVAETDEFVQPLRTARAVWIDGGRQWRLADSYLDTRTEKELHAVLARGGVIGGSSAGATIQGSYLVRGAPSGNTIMMSPGHEAGFGFLRNCAIDQHVIARKRERDLCPVVLRFPHLLAFGIDEATAMVVQGDEARILGASGVLVHNGNEVQDDPDLPYFALKPGDTFDLALRKRKMK